MSDKKEDDGMGEQQTASASSVGAKLPVLLEVVFDLSKLIMVVVCLAVAGISYISGATWLDIALRTGVAMAIVGILLIVIARAVVSASINATNTMLEQAVKPGTTIDQQG